jgi:YbgC/YbaW family acyl-CoA thioester hydrolase
MKKHELRLRVRSYELDVFNHVNNAVYLNYIEMARVEMLQKAGVNLEEVIARKELIAVVNITINYRSAAYLNDEILIMTHISKLGNSSFTMRHEGYNLTLGNKLCFDADVVHVIADATTNKSIPLPDALRQRFAEFNS